MESGWKSCNMSGQQTHGGFVLTAPVTAVHVNEDQERLVGWKVEGCVRYKLVFAASHSFPSLVCFLLQVPCCPSFPLRSLPPLLGGCFSHFLFFWTLLAFVLRFKKRQCRWTRKILRYGELSQPKGGGQGRIARSRLVVE